MRAIACVISAAAVCAVSVCPSIASADSSRAIFRCELNGVPTFSDRPCAAASSRYEPDPIATNTYDPPPIRPSPPAPVKPSSAKPTSPAADSSNHKETCERLARGLKETRSKLRAGYKAGEGERIKERQARLKSQLRQARCS
jgi:hypothetical protein